MPSVRLCVSHTVTGTASLRINRSTGAGFTITVPSGTYWTDPVYGTALVQTSSPCLLGEIAQLLIDAMTGVPLTWTKAYVTTAVAGIYQARHDTSETARWRMENAAATAAGRLVARRIGVDPVRAYPEAAADPVDTMLCCGIWEAGRVESADVDEVQDLDTGGVTISDDGTAYALYTGDPTSRRVLSLAGVSSALTRRRARFPDIKDLSSTYYDTSYETLIHQWTRRGEKIRLYEDSSKTFTYLTAAVTATDTTITVASTTGFASDTTVCVDGEWMALISLSSGTTWNVRRHDPVAHSNYAPVGVAAFVATYLLDNDGGNVNRGSFAPARRAYNDDRFDLSVALVRSAS